MNEYSQGKDSDLMGLLPKDKLVHDTVITEVTPCLSDSDRTTFLSEHVFSVPNIHAVTTILNEPWITFQGTAKFC